MSIEEKSLFDQLTAGLAGDSTPEPDETEETVETPEAEEPEQEAEETPEGEEPAEETEEGEEPAEETEEEETEEGEEPPAKKQEPAAKPLDPINDPLPKGTLATTQDRFKKIVDIVKEKDAKIVELEARASEGDELVQTVTSTGMDGQKFGVLLDYARGVNSGDPNGMEHAFGIIKSEFIALAKALGEPVPGENPLTGHPDLIQAIKDQKVDPALAVETAINRNRAAAREKLRTTHGSEQQRTQQQQRATESGRAAMTSLGKQLAAKDGVNEYKRKAAIAVGMLEETMKSVPPHMWAKTFRNVYDRIPAAPKAAKPGLKPGAKKVVNQPLRGNKRPSGNSTQKAPKSLLDAVKGAFQQGD